MSTYDRLTKLAQVRHDFTEEGTWRDALGGAEPLRCFVTDSPLDAPNVLPAGSMRAAGNAKYPPIATVSNRPAWY